MSDLSDIRDGIQTVLQAAITDLRVQPYPEEGIRDYPCLILEPTNDIDYHLTLGDTTKNFQGFIIGTLYVTHGDDNDGWREVDNYRSPTGTKSIKTGIRTDITLGGAVDHCWVRINNQTVKDRDNTGAINEFSTRFQFWFVKSS